ncbi:MAG: ORF6N domain-containing protein [Bacteroidales bacterium]|nr:ORF6N domain-containing protein [Bacteroidales bacterium]
MSEIVKYEQVKDKVIVLRGEPVLLDADVAALYGVETKRVNEAVKNNPDKFPEGFLFKLDKQETADLRSKILTSSSQEPENQQDIDMWSKISTSSWGGSRYAPTAFTESGLYMLATILKSPRATQTTIAIIKTFVQLREMSRTMQAAAMAEDPAEKKSLMQKSGELIGNIIGSQFETVGTETEIELNLAMVKIRHKVIRGNKDDK